MPAPSPASKAKAGASPLKAPSKSKSPTKSARTPSKTTPAKKTPAKSTPSSAAQVGGKTSSRITPVKKTPTKSTPSKIAQVIAKSPYQSPTKSSQKISDAIANKARRGSIDKVAPGIQKAKGMLERSMTKDQVHYLLETRPTKEDVEKAGILKEKGGMASSLSAKARQLERNMITDKVGHLLEKRANLQDLESRDILHTGTAPAIQATQKKLQMQLAKSNLYHALAHRPSIVDLVETGLYRLHGDADDEELQFEDAQGETEDFDVDESFNYDSGRRGDVPLYYDDEDDEDGDGLEDVEEDDDSRWVDNEGNVYDKYGALLHHGYEWDPEEEEYYDEDDEHGEDDDDLIYDENGQAYVEGEDGRLYPVYEGDLDGQDAEYGDEYDVYGDEAGEGHGDYSEYAGDGNPYDYDADVMPVEEEEEASHRAIAFTLSKVLLQTAANLCREGEISLAQKGRLKDLIVDQDNEVVSAAMDYIETGNFPDFKDALLDLVS